MGNDTRSTGGFGDDAGRGATRALVNVLLALAGLALITWFLTLAGYDPIGWVDTTVRGWFE